MSTSAATRVLVTGASGFVGRAVVSAARKDPALEVRAAVRSACQSLPEGTECVIGPDLMSDAAWGDALGGVDAVVHSAARVHVMRETVADPLAEFRQANVEGTLRLAREAAQTGVRRFVFISSIKVNGEGTAPGHPYTAADTPQPADPYGVSKHEAEQALFALGRETGLEVVVIRPVLVYGPGVRANFAQLLRWLHRGVPLPFGAVNNRRSLVGLDNLVDLILTCVRHPEAAGQVFLVSDGEDLSTPDLLRRAAHALGTRARLVPVPVGLMRTAASLAGRRDLANRLFGSLQVDISPTRKRLGWSPPVGVDRALASAAEAFLQGRAR